PRGEADGHGGLDHDRRPGGEATRKRDDLLDARGVEAVGAGVMGRSCLSAAAVVTRAGVNLLERPRG
ncbi:hypothetical protein, partial [Paracoccus sanguinis]|uniref:hypothetical protein n=1 Tax=Paracoccus sanguinis TaxID=1545044 RepID=UPI001E56F260